MTFGIHQDINTPCIKTDNVREFGDGENCEFETVFVLKDFQAPEYSYLYKNDSRILGPPAVMYCASKGEVRPKIKQHKHTKPSRGFIFPLEAIK